MCRVTGALLIALIVGTGVGSSQASREGLLAGWRYPQESDYVGDWQEFRAKIPIPFHVSADFNGDGTKDDAWLMIRRDGDGWALFAFLRRRVGMPLTVRLETGQGKAQRYGLALADPGTYRTACGKGYFPCRSNEPKSVTLKNPGFEWFLYESASLLYFWDESGRSFRQIHLSD